MCLLDRVESWDADGILCTARSHLDPLNPLRRDGRLGIACAAEYAMQAAAVHGALMAGGHAPPGYAAALRDLRFGAARLDDPAHGTLHVAAALDRADAAGSIYRLAVRTAGGAMLLTGRATILTPTA